MLKKLILKLMVIVSSEFDSLVLRRIMKSWFNVDVGLYSYGCFDASRIPRNSVIGRYCSLSSTCSFFPRNHGLKFMSLHPYLYNSSLGVVSKDTIVRTRFIVEDDVWIGHNATITAKANVIGRGSVIAANSVVTENVPRYAVVAGVPAKVIKYRFPEGVIEEIERSEWWVDDKVTLKERLADNSQMYFNPREYYETKY